jgi:hypothetical protein
MTGACRPFARRPMGGSAQAADPGVPRPDRCVAARLLVVFGATELLWTQRSRVRAGDVEPVWQSVGRTGWEGQPKGNWGARSRHRVGGRLSQRLAAVRSFGRDDWVHPILRPLPPLSRSISSGVRSGNAIKRADGPYRRPRLSPIGSSQPASAIWRSMARALPGDRPRLVAIRVVRTGARRAPSRIAGHSAAPLAPCSSITRRPMSPGRAAVTRLRMARRFTQIPAKYSSHGVAACSAGAYVGPCVSWWE